MESIPLNSAQKRYAFFTQTVLNNLTYWQNWLNSHNANADALNRELSSSIIRAITFALELEDAWPRAYKLTLDFSPHIERRGHWEAWGQVLKKAISSARQAEDASAETELAILLTRLRFQQGRFKETISAYRQVIRLARQNGDQRNEARACSNLGYLFTEQGYWHRAEVLCCYALTIFEQIDNNHGRAHTHNHLGALYSNLRRFAQAEHHLKLACAIWQKMGDERGLTRGYINLSAMYLRQGDAEKALHYLNSALSLAKATNSDTMLGAIYLNTGLANRLTGNLAQAETCARQAETHYHQLSNLAGLAQAWNNLGYVYFHQGRQQEAILYTEKALALWRSLGSKTGQVETLTNLIECELHEKNYHQGAARLAEVERLVNRSQPGRYHYLQDRLAQFRHSLTERAARQAATD